MKLVVLSLLLLSTLVSAKYELLDQTNPLHADRIRAFQKEQALRAPVSKAAAPATSFTACNFYPSTAVLRFVIIAGSLTNIATASPGYGSCQTVTVPGLTAGSSPSVTLNDADGNAVGNSITYTSSNANGNLNLLIARRLTSGAYEIEAPVSDTLAANQFRIFILNYANNVGNVDLIIDGTAAITGIAEGDAQTLDSDSDDTSASQVAFAAAGTTSPTLGSASSVAGVADQAVLIVALTGISGDATYPLRLIVGSSPAGGGCFSANNQVLVEGPTVNDNKKMNIKDITVGQKVLSADEQGNLFFDKVFRITHWSDDSNVYHKISTADGQSVELTADHYIHANACCDLDLLVPASDVTVGDMLYTVSQEEGVETVTPSEVTSVEMIYTPGVYNVHTLNGNIVVNDIVASHFTGETTWNTKSWAPVWYKAVDFFGSVTGSEPEDASRN